MSLSLPADAKPPSWAAEQLGIGVSTAHRLVGTGQIPGAFRVGVQWRISGPRAWSGGASRVRDGRSCLRCSGTCGPWWASAPRPRSAPATGRGAVDRNSAGSPLPVVDLCHHLGQGAIGSPCPRSGPAVAGADRLGDLDGSAVRPPSGVDAQSPDPRRHFGFGALQKQIAAE